MPRAKYDLVNISINVDKPVTDDFDSTYLFEKFIHLETKKESFIAELTKVVVTPDSLIIILDKKQEAIFIFNFSGKFLTAIRKLGGGPEEYRNIKDITYNKSEESVVVLDIGTQSLLSYSIPTGKFLKSSKIKHRETYGYTIDYLSGNYLFNRSNFSPRDYPGQLAIADASDLTVKGHGIPQLKAIVNSPVKLPHPLDVSDSIALSLDFLNDTIYQIKDTNISPAYYFNYPEDKASKIAKDIMEGSNDYGDSYIEELFSDDGIWNFSNLFAVDDFIYFTFSYNNATVVNIFNKSNLKSFSVAPFPVLNDSLFVHPPIAKIDDFLISTVLAKESRNILPDQNPTLCLYKIKR